MANCISHFNEHGSITLLLHSKTRLTENVLPLTPALTLTLILILKHNNVFELTKRCPFSRKCTNINQHRCYDFEANTWYARASSIGRKGSSILNRQSSKQSH